MNGLSASVVADSIQGDHSVCAKPLVDIDLKVAFPVDIDLKVAV